MCSTQTCFVIASFILLHFFFFFISPSFSDPRISEFTLYCATTKANSTAFVPTFVKEMEGLSQLLTTSHRYFATYHLNTTSSLPIYALAQCHHDLSQTDCLLCFAASRTKLPRCLPSLSASIFLDGCFLRYDNYSFYKESLSPSLGAVKCGGGNFSGEGVGYVVGNVSERAVKNGGGFGVGEVNGVYGLAQCWESVGREGCRECLEWAKKALLRCGGKGEGRAMNAGCYLRYSTLKFYDDDGQHLAHAHGFGAGLGLIIVVVIASTLLLVLSLFAACIRLSKFKQEHNNVGKLPSSLSKSSLSLKYETLEKATDYFNPAKKLGQGGAGSVYMGTLPSGQTVAVKRLIFNTRQWVDDFFNEVNLISGIQHKNLVKLLGCSIEGPESLLVYEFVPNKSLDQFLFDKNRTRTLNWKQRFDVIVGTAEGIAHLHGGSEVRIIHRDIKSSNILLDENLTPKIADFGLVRCFGADKTHLSTGIAGTLGYMAPEYLVRGQLTDKADVYSFGVLVLEIVSGKRCNTIIEDSKSLLQTVWQLYKSNRLFEAVDPCLRNNFPVEEASFVLQIGLLCAQASVALRPSMEQVVRMLSDTGAVIPAPRQPPFINATMLGGENSTRSYSSVSFVSNTAVTKGAASYTSSESSSMHSSDRPSRSEELTIAHSNKSQIRFQ